MFLIRHQTKRFFDWDTFFNGRAACKNVTLQHHLMVKSVTVKQLLLIASGNY